VREDAAACRACGLWKHATQTVFGEGAPHVALMLVGEQPGDREDLAGQPFVGPAGRILDDALDAAGIDRSDVYVTNAVKHFKWRPSGKRRIHDKPTWTEVQACLPWLRAELDLVAPRVVVAMGATAGQALLGRDFRVTKSRGQALQMGDGRSIVATIHPSAVLRARDDDSRRRLLALLIEDLGTAAQLATRVAA
jgi:uracil-DNA glycosylase family protein